MPSKAAYHHGNLKPALIAAALKEISREGPDGFSLRGVARRAGVSAPAVYRHFKDKDDLLAAVAAECSQRLGVEVAESLRKAPDNPLEQFRATGIALVKFAASRFRNFIRSRFSNIGMRLARSLPRAHNNRKKAASHEL